MNTLVRLKNRYTAGGIQNLPFLVADDVSSGFKFPNHVNLVGPVNGT